MKENSPIYIIEEIWTYLSPFSAHQIEIWGEKFATVEHAYQSAKYTGKAREDIKKHQKCLCVLATQSNLQKRQKYIEPKL